MYSQAARMVRVARASRQRLAWCATASERPVPLGEHHPSALLGPHIAARATKPVRMRFAEAAGSSVQFGFTDGTAFAYEAGQLRDVAGASCPVPPALAQVVAAELSDGAKGVRLTWDGGAGGACQTTLSADSLRAAARGAARDLGPASLRRPVRGPAVWTGADLSNSQWWDHRLTAEEVEDLISATAVAKRFVEWVADGVPGPVDPHHFPLGASLAAKLAAIADEIEYGRGLAMIRNMPVDDPRLTEADLAVMYVALSGYIGHVVLQSSSGLRSVSRGYGLPLGRIQAEMTGETPAGGRQTNNHFRFHTDRCDVISLLSLRTAPRGGASRVCSAPAVYNAMLERAPHLAEELTRPIDRIWEGDQGFFRLPVVGLTPSGQFTTQISPSYVENAQFLPNAAKATQSQLDALDAIEEIGMELGAEFTMMPGMMSFLNNHQVYHGRGGWSVTEEEQAGSWGSSGRLLYRTWISPFNSRPLPDTPDYRKIWGSVEGGAPRGGWDQAVKNGETPKPEIPEGHVYYSVYSDRVQRRSMDGHCGTVVAY